MFFKSCVYTVGDHCVLDFSVIETVTTVAAAGTIVAAAAAAQPASTLAMSSMPPGQVPNSVIQPGSGIFIYT